MKPGPAMSVFAISGASASAATMACATSRGFIPTRLASCRATLVAKSPWSAFFGRSSSTVASPASGKAARTAPATRAARRVLGSASVTVSGASRKPTIIRARFPPTFPSPVAIPLFRWISRWRESADFHVGLDSLIARARPDAAVEDRLAWLRDLAAWLLAGGAGTPEAGDRSPQAVRLQHLLGLLERQPDAKAAFAAMLRATLEQRDAFDLLIETGMPRESGFVAEFLGRVLARVLPEPPATDLAGLFLQVFPSRAHAEIVQGISDENWSGIQSLLAHGDTPGGVQAQLGQAAARALESLATQVCAATLPSAVRRRMQVTEGQSLAAWDLPAAATAFSRTCLTGYMAERELAADALRRVVERSLVEIEQAYTHLDLQGVSIAIVYQLERIRAQLKRIAELTDLLAAPESAARMLPRFVANLIRDVHDHRSAIALLNQNFELAARKVVERSAETGEHYITRDRAEYADMVKRASGGGAVLAVTTYVKFAFAALHWPPFFDGFLASINYAASFVFIQFAGFTVATKQPAMTAPALAARMKELTDPSGWRRSSTTW